jgi:hypothetical protein
LRGIVPAADGPPASRLTTHRQGRCSAYGPPLPEDRISDPAKLFEDPLVSGDWCVEKVEVEGAVELAIFSGPEARDRAVQYADWRYRLFTELP